MLEENLVRPVTKTTLCSYPLYYSTGRVLTFVWVTVLVDDLHRSVPLTKYALHTADARVATYNIQYMNDTPASSLGKGNALEYFKKLWCLQQKGIKAKCRWHNR
eukprot:IDg14599t1